LLIEISSLNVHNGPLSELDPNDEFRRLFEALQGWRMSMAATCGPLYAPDQVATTNRRPRPTPDRRRILAEAHQELSIPRQLNMSLVSLLDKMWALARREDVGQAMLRVIVRRVCLSDSSDRDAAWPTLTDFGLHTGH
jgi:hypothetical protein